MSAVQLDELRFAIGDRATLALCQTFGGRRLYFPVPERVRGEHQIALAVGLDAARTLCRRWGREVLYIPLARSLRREERNRALLGDVGELSVEKIARKYDLTARHVHYVIARARRRR